MHPDPIEALADAIGRNPNFKASALHYINTDLHWRKQLGIFGFMMNSYSRAYLMAYVCLAYFGAPSDQPEDGATFSRIWELVDSRKDFGKRSLRTFLGVATLFGMLTKVRGSSDTRVYAYVPSPKMIEKYIEHMITAFACIDILAGGGNRAATANANPTFLAPMLRKMAPPVLSSGVMFERKDDRLARVIRLNGGFPILLALARAEILGEKRPRPVELSKLFKVSNSQARAVIEEIDAISLGNENGSDLAPRTAFDHFKQFVSRELAVYIKYYFEEEELFMQAVSMTEAA